MDDIRELSVNELIRRLHESVSGFVAGMENVIGMNREAPRRRYRARARITERLKKGEEITDNRKVIGLWTFFFFFPGTRRCSGSSRRTPRTRAWHNRRDRKADGLEEAANCGRDRRNKRG